MLKASRLLSGRGAGTWTQAWFTGALLLTTTLVTSWSCNRVGVSRPLHWVYPSEKSMSRL